MRETLKFRKKKKKIEMILRHQIRLDIYVLCSRKKRASCQKSWVLITQHEESCWKIFHVQEKVLLYD